MSFGFSGVITNYSAADIESAFSLSLDALRQQNKSRGNRSIFVVAAGNAWNDLDEFGNVVDASSPELLPGLPYLFPELQDHMLAVVAVDSSGEISFSPTAAAQLQTSAWPHPAAAKPTAMANLIAMKLSGAPAHHQQMVKRIGITMPAPWVPPLPPPWSVAPWRC